MKNNEDYVTEPSEDPRGVSNVEKLIRTTSYKSVDWVVLTGEVPPLPENQRRIYKPVTPQEPRKPPSTRKPSKPDKRLSSRNGNRYSRPNRDENCPSVRGTVPPNFTLLRREPGLSSDVRVTLGTTITRNVYDPKKSESKNAEASTKQVSQSRRNKTLTNEKYRKTPRQNLTKSRNPKKTQSKDIQPLDEPRKSPFDFTPLSMPRRSMSEQNLGSSLMDNQAPYFPLNATKTIIKQDESRQKPNLRPVKPAKSIFGDAKPVDTAKKMAEIEARLRKV